MILRVLTRPLALLGRRRAAGPSGWIELVIEGEVRELPPARGSLLKRLMRSRDESPKVILSALDRFAREVVSDPRTKGVLVRLGPFGGGWASAMRIHRALRSVKASGRHVVVHITQVAGNKEYAVATAGSRISCVPTGILAAVGTSANTLFLGEALARVGVKVEVASAGRYKSAPDALTKSARTEPDREQAEALVTAFDGALIDVIVEGRKLPIEDAKKGIDSMPLTGAHAISRGFTDGTAHDEDLPEQIQALDKLEDPPELVAAGDYLGARVLPPLLRGPRKHIGIVEVHGAIVDRQTPYLGMLDAAAVEKSVVSDLRAALANRRVGAVVLHVNSRGGSVIASDAIWSAVKRLNAEKPVIACFADVAASGGYYVACGARAIVASPLTVTGSIGVFGMLPTWPGITAKLHVHPDAIEHRLHASMADPWRERTEEERAHAQVEVEGMYHAFITLVGQARNKTIAEVDAIAQGRVWTGADAHARGLVDGLGGIDEALERCRAATKDRMGEYPVLIRAKKPHPRPEPPKASTAALLELLGPSQMVLEALAVRASAPWASGWVWSPLDSRA